MTTIPKDVDTENYSDLTPSDAESAFLRRWNLDAEEPSEDEVEAPEDEVEEETDEASENEEAEETDEDSEEPEDQSEEETEADKKEAEDKFIDDDNVKVKIKVGDEELTASVKDLKRLYGQEASLTKKSQEISQKRKEVEDQSSLHLTGLQKLYERAVDRYKPYSEIDMLVASKQMDAEELSILRQEAAKAYEDVRFLETELRQSTTAVEQAKAKALQEQAQEALKVLQDPEKGIKGWSPEVAESIRQYALQNGMADSVVNKLVDPVIIKALYKAMQFDKSKTVATVKKSKAPTKVLKSKTSSEGGFKSADTDKAISSLRKSGSRDDAANAFLSRWKVK
jgi:hypothetical protein